MHEAFSRHSLMEFSGLSQDVGSMSSVREEKERINCCARSQTEVGQTPKLLPSSQNQVFYGYGPRAEQCGAVMLNFLILGHFSTLYKLLRTPKCFYVCDLYL